MFKGIDFSLAIALVAFLNFWHGFPFHQVHNMPSFAERLNLSQLSLVRQAFSCFRAPCTRLNISLKHVDGFWSFMSVGRLLQPEEAYQRAYQESLSRLSYGCLFHSFPCKIWVKPSLAEPLGIPICLLLRLPLLLTALMGMEFPHAQLPIRWAFFYGHEDAEVHSLTLSDMGSKRRSG